MYVIGLTPLKKGVHLDTLSYFSNQTYPHGSILEIPVRNKTIFGIVTHSEEVSAAKTALRAATFSLKKLPVQENAQALSKAYIQTAQELSEYYACSLSEILYAILPPEIRNGVIPLPHAHHTPARTQHTPEVLQADAHERERAYRSLVREAFAHGGSTQIIVPSPMEARHMFEKLSSGIEDRTILCTSTLTPKQKEAAFKQLEDYSKPKLIITTTAYAILERHDITTMLIEHARSQQFNSRTRPYLDLRKVTEIYARYTERRLIFSDLLPRSEEEQKRRDGVLLTHGETPKRLELSGKLEIVHMKPDPNASTVFSLFSDTAIKAIEKTVKEKGKIFLFSARRGLAPVVACIDCGHIFRSPNTGAPYSLVRIKKNDIEERWFVCPTSGHRERAADICPKCSSWRLRERGVGIQAVYDELIRKLKNTPIILFDHTTAGTLKKALFLRDRFYKTKGAVLLGTQMVLPYLTEPVSRSVVVNMDSLYATPTWRLQGENLALLLRLREITSEELYIQTRSKADELLKHAQRGSVELFYNEELELRKTFNYPPFTNFIHLTWQGSDQFTNELEILLKKELGEYQKTFYSAPPSPKNTRICYCLVRIASKDWPKKDLGELLRKLPPSVRIMIDPDKVV
jgi:primosomal protein N' (replication factor Y)